MTISNNDMEKLVGTLWYLNRRLQELDDATKKPHAEWNSNSIVWMAEQVVDTLCKIKKLNIEAYHAVLKYYRGDLGLAKEVIKAKGKES